MSESVLVVGYDYDEVKELQKAGRAHGIVCDHAESPIELVRLAQTKRYNCIFCNIDVLDSLSYIHLIRKIKVTPIIIGTIEDCKSISVFSHYIKIAEQATPPHFEAIVLAPFLYERLHHTYKYFFPY